jgi:hypothetical protein
LVTVEVAGLEAERLRLVELSKARDEAALERKYASLVATNPRLLAESTTTPEARAGVRAWIEAWDTVLHEWVLSDAAVDDSWRALLMPEASGGFAFRHLGLMAFWLAEVGSERLGASELPDGLAELSLDQQARALGRFCTRNDGRTAVDYAGLHDALHPDLRPFLAHWALTVHLVSPTASFDSAVGEQRRSLCADFARCHAEQDLGLVADPLYFQAAYRAIYHSADPHDFVSTLSDRVFAPRLAAGVARATRAALEQQRQRAARRQKQGKGKGRKSGKSGGGSKAQRPKGLGVLLSCFGEHHAVRRSTEPLLAELRDAGAWRGYFPDGDRDAAQGKLGSRWAGENARLVAADAARLPDAQALAGRIAADNLDFLFFPEVGISTCSAVLATQRLARVQAATYGHPATSGSRELDYFVSGIETEDGSARYRERLVLLPGLGVASNPPPKPFHDRRRPLEGEACRFASLSSIDKLNGELLEAWRGVLESAGTRAELHHFPGAKGGAATAIESAAHAALGRSACYELQPAMPRGVLLQRLLESDVLLDSFPFSGFNTLVDALSLSLPVITLRRPGFAGGLGAAILTRLGCAEECVATTTADFVSKAARLAQDPALRLDLRARLNREHVLSVLCDDSLGAHFRAAVDWMRETGPRSFGAPVYIEAGEAPRVLDDWPRR